LSIRANKNLSNLGVRFEAEAEVVISITGFRTLDRALGSAAGHFNSI
jgi:hypothetical protein